MIRKKQSDLNVNHGVRSGSGPGIVSAYPSLVSICSQRVTHTRLLLDISNEEELTPSQGSHFYFKTALIVRKYT